MNRMPNAEPSRDESLNRVSDAVADAMFHHGNRDAIEFSIGAMMAVICRNELGPAPAEPMLSQVHAIMLQCNDRILDSLLEFVNDVRNVTRSLDEN